MSRTSAASAARTAAGGKVFVTPMMRMAAGSRPARRATSATAARTAAARAATSSGKEPGLRERARDLRQREPDHVGERAFDARDERRTAPLDRIAARLVERLAALHVRRDHGGAERSEAHARDHALVGLHGPSRIEQHEARDDAMLAPAEAAEHRGRIGAVHGLAEDVAVDLDHGVGAQHPRRPPPRGAGGRLGGGEPPDELRRGLARPRALVDVGRDNHEVDAEPAEQLAAAGRRGGEHELHAPDGRGRVARCQVVGPRGAWYHGRVGRGVWGALLVLAACLARPAPLAPGAREGVRGPRGEPLASGLAALVAGDGAEAAHLFADAARRYPPLADYALYFEARAAMSVGRGDDARDLLARLLADHPDSVWKSRAALLAGALARTAGDLDGARAWLGTARAGLPAGSDRWAWATVALAEIADRRGDHEPALDLARAVRRGRPHGLADRRARRLTERIREAHPDVFGGAEAEAGEAEMRLGEGDLAGARAVAAAVLDSAPTAPIRARALWVRAQAEHALGRAAEAEATCLAVTEAASEPLAPRALAAAARWRWNADEDEQALRLFHDAVRRFPGSAAAAEALYAIGRIHQEAERYGAAHAAYVELAARYPRAPRAAPAARASPPSTGTPAPSSGSGGKPRRGPGSCTSPIGIRRRTTRRSPRPVSGARHPRRRCPPPVRRPSPPMWAGRTASAPACSSGWPWPASRASSSRRSRRLRPDPATATGCSRPTARSEPPARRSGSPWRCDRTRRARCAAISTRSATGPRSAPKPPRVASTRSWCSRSSGRRASSTPRRCRRPMPTG